MNSFIVLSCIHVMLGSILVEKVDGVRFNAITDSHMWYLHKLYREAHNEEPLASWDPATGDAPTRLTICEDISRNAMFQRYGKNPVNMDTVIIKLLRQSQYADILHRLYGPDRTHGYTNEYAQRDFEVTQFIHEPNHVVTIPLVRKEHVFMCLSEDEHSYDLVPYYVSKAYGNAFRQYRFLFTEKGNYDSFQPIMLAEESAEAYSTPDFNVELHYLQMRSKYNLVEDPDLDPVCKLSTAGLEDSYGFRLCAIILNSPYFADKIKYKSPIFWNACYEEEISFRTLEGIENSAGNSYYERLVSCHATLIDNDEGCWYHVSRAYNNNHVFVYSYTNERELYIENLSIKVDIVHDYHNFSDVEL